MLLFFRPEMLLTQRTDEKGQQIAPAQKLSQVKLLKHPAAAYQVISLPCFPH